MRYEQVHLELAPSCASFGNNFQPCIANRNLERRSSFPQELQFQVSVETPQKLTAKQRELLKEFEKESSKDTQPESVGFFNRMKEFFAGGEG